MNEDEYLKHDLTKIDVSSEQECPVIYLKLDIDVVKEMIGACGYYIAVPYEEGFGVCAIPLKEAKSCEELISYVNKCINGDNAQPVKLSKQDHGITYCEIPMRIGKHPFSIWVIPRKSTEENVEPHTESENGTPLLHLIESVDINSSFPLSSCRSHADKKRRNLLLIRLYLEDDTLDIDKLAILLKTAKSVIVDLISKSFYIRLDRRKMQDLKLVLRLKRRGFSREEIISKYFSTSGDELDILEKEFLRFRKFYDGIPNMPKY